MANRDLLRKLGIEHPIGQAPMGGGFSTPELVAAAANAGALGSLGAPYLTPEQIAKDIARIRALTDRPFNVNLFCGGYASRNEVDPAPMLAEITAIHAAYGLPPPALPPMPVNPFSHQLEVILDLRPAVFSFTFGIPDAAAMHRLKSAGIVVMGTATTVHEGRLLAEAGVDAVVAQGVEAGAHRGTFAGPFEASMVPTLDLVRGLIAAIEVPVIAAGGLMDGRDIASALTAGAISAQLGTAFLTCPEAGTPLAHKQAILAARSDTTVITRAFSGRPARGIRNSFIARFEWREHLIPPFRLQNDLTRPLRAEAAKRADTAQMSLWAGTGLVRAREMPAAELIKTLVGEIAAAENRRR